MLECNIHIEKCTNYDEVLLIGHIHVTSPEMEEQNISETLGIPPAPAGVTLS